MAYDVDYVRAQFPALNLEVEGRPAVFFDGPGGTQTPRRVIDRVADYYVHSNANSGGVFLTSERNDAMLRDVRGAFADFFACDWDEVSFCANATTISYKLSHALARDLKPGDEAIVTDIDHEANRGPWDVLAERGLVVRSVRVDPATCTLDLDHYRSLLSEKTRVVAFNHGSNAVGTISDAAEIVRLAREVGALTIADAVHYALHGTIDVRAIGIDFLFCSAYKFFGPHVGILYARREAMERLRTLRLCTQKPHAPDKFETGTLNHEGIAGAGEALEFIADLGRVCGDPARAADADATPRRRDIVAGMRAIEDHERPLAEYFKDELARIDGVRLYGPPREHPCTSTIAFRVGDRPPKDVARALGAKGIFTWAGNFYARRLIETLGLADRGGLVRIGLAPYNTRAEIDRTRDVSRALATASHGT